jgi:hypothetical protein
VGHAVVAVVLGLRLSRHGVHLRSDGSAITYYEQQKTLKLQYPDDQSMHVSHETIYRSLFIQARGVLKANL